MLGHIAYLLGMAARLPLQLADQTTKAKTMTIQSTRITRLMNTIMLAVAVFTACALAGCSTYSKVSEKRPRYQPLGVATGTVTKAEAEIVEALRRERRDPLAALGGYLAAAETAAQQLQRNPNDSAHARLQLCRRPHLRHHPRGEARSVDAAAARAGGGRRLRAHAQARSAQAVESGALRFHAGGSVRRERHLCHGAHDARKASARRSSPSGAR